MNRVKRYKLPVVSHSDGMFSMRLTVHTALHIWKLLKE